MYETNSFLAKNMKQKEINTPDDIRRQEKDHQIFRQFLTEIQTWSQIGPTPSVASPDLIHYLDLRKKRLQKHGLTETITLKPGGNIELFQDFTVLSPSEQGDKIAYHAQYYQSASQKRNMRKMEKSSSGKKVPAACIRTWCIRKQNRWKTVPAFPRTAIHKQPLIFIWIPLTFTIKEYPFLKRSL